MTKARVPLWGNPQKSVEVERGATAGAVIGRDVFNPDGSLFVPGAVATPTASLPVTVWEKVANIPANVQAVAGLTGDGFVRKAGTAWTASAIVNADLSGANTDGLTEGATNLYHTPERVRDVMGTALVAGSNITITVNDGADTITIAATGSGPSTTDGLAEGVTNLYYTDARVDARIAAAGTGGILPMVNGDVPPTLMYAEDGSLIYFEVE